MSKVFSVIFSLIFSLVLVIFSTPSVYGLDTCKSIQINPPPPIFSNTTSATFTLDVGGGTADYKGWKIGIPTSNVLCSTNITSTVLTPIDAAKEIDGKSISIKVDNTLTIGRYRNCVFYPGTQKLKAIAVRTDDIEVPICEASYKVEDANAQCTLTITPDKDITPASTVSVSGTGLIPRSIINLIGYRLFFDNKMASGNVDTPGSSSFSGFMIPGSSMSIGNHQIDLRYPSVSWSNIPAVIKDYVPVITTGNYYFGSDQSANYFGSPLCHVNFCIGTPDKPCGVISGGTGGTTAGCTGAGCSFGGGTSCDNDKNNPGIQTAIGCIHTNPAALIQDFLKFILGISGGIAFLLMLLGAFGMLTSAGNPDKLGAGKERLESAVIGLLFIIFSVLFFQILGANILGIEGFK